MTWRLANSLIKLLKQVNEAYPNRNKDSDGSIGDEHHSARTSDHNPDEHGVVRAIDITHDPAHGFDSYKFADMLLAKQDPRLKYVISNRRIGSGPEGIQPGVWRDYKVPPNKNPHDHHCHVSCMPRRANGVDPGDDSKLWVIDGVMVTPEASAFVLSPPTLRPGASNDAVERLQKALGVVPVTGKYEPRSETYFALCLFQIRHGLDPDGICGPQTWKAIAPEPKVA